jgi:mannopine transport system permease protein
MEAALPMVAPRRSIAARAARSWRSWVLTAFCCLVLFFLVGPILLVVPISFSGSEYLEFPPKSLSLRWYATYFSDHEWIAATLFSLKIAALTALTATIIGAAAAFGLVRSGLSRVDFVGALIAAPMITPAIITAVAFYLVLSRAGLVGTTTGFVLAHTALTLPLVIVSVSASLQGIDPKLEAAAMSLGAPVPSVLARVTLPLALPGIVIAAAFAFIYSFDEATVSFFVSTPSGKTLPKKMFEGIEWELSPVIAVVSTLLTLISFALVLLIAAVRGLRRGAAPQAGFGATPM